MMDLRLLNEQSDQYSRRLNDFVDQSRLPESWFDHGYDHLAIKAYTIDDYEQTIERFKAVSELITEVDIDDRQIATAELLGEFALTMSVSFGNYVSIKHIEIMLARLGDQNHDSPRLDHAEIYMPRGLVPVRKVLSNKRIPYFDELNEAHSWVSVVFGEESDEVKFTDRKLSDINQQQIESSRARIIYEAHIQTK